LSGGEGFGIRGGIQRFLGSETAVFSLTWRSPQVTRRVWSILVVRAEELTVWCTDRILRASCHEYRAREPLWTMTGRWHCHVLSRCSHVRSWHCGARLRSTCASGQSRDRHVRSTTVRGCAHEQATELYCRVRSCRAARPVNLC
jgi:hypothetical protein